VSGPFETERQAAAASLWATHGREAGMHMDKANLADLAAALSGVDLGAYDRRIVEWLAGYEPSTVAVICGLVSRARCPDEDAGQLAAIRAVLARFDWEHDDRQYALEEIDRIAGGAS
jgi:hypothetical protein